MSAPDGESGVVLWDFDGTLAWRDGMWRGCLLTALDQVCASHTVTMDLLRQGLKDGFPWHRPERHHPHLDTADRWWDALRPVLVGAYEAAGVDRATAVAAAALVPDVFVDPRYWTVFDDTRPALTRLRDAGWRHTVVSNHVPELPALLADLGLADLVDDVLTSAVTGYEKPRREMFELALSRSGEPDRVWMVGDNPVADVAGAEAAGIPAILVRAPADADLHRAADIVLGA